MTELRKRLHIPLPEINFVKAYAGDVIVSQKSLSKLQERIVYIEEEGGQLHAFEFTWGSDTKVKL